ncbi:MAG TPA: metal-dependent hydrolase, partial [Saprospiraceae bacterium]|nr:metal-dependent hydrolase [Saprospiraceae bacterium]
MEETMVFALRYPIGKYQTHEVWSEKLKDQYIGNIADLPYLIELNTKDITKEQLAYLYRPEGWSINEVVHHLVDSHMNAFIRFKLALTEDNPVIKP